MFNFALPDDVVNSLVHNRYQVEKVLGQGGFGRVYKGLDTALNIPVAVKMLFNPSPDAVAQFKLEAQVLAQLHHPGLPRVIDYFSENHRHFLVMDYIDGDDLQSAFSSPQFLPVDTVLVWITQVLETLEYIHNLDIIHRDIKPGNIRINSNNQAILVDFGIAKTGSRQVTAMGAKGAFTPSMASPEQSQMTGTTTAASDIYSVGATLYCLLTKQFPTDAVSRLMMAPLPSPSDLSPHIPQELSAVIERAMELNPHARFRSAAEMRKALENICTGGLIVPAIVPPGAPARASPPTSSGFRRDIRRK